MVERPRLTSLNLVQTPFGSRACKVQQVVAQQLEQKARTARRRATKTSLIPGTSRQRLSLKLSPPPAGLVRQQRHRHPSALRGPLPVLLPPPPALPRLPHLCRPVHAPCPRLHCVAAHRRALLLLPAQQERQDWVPPEQGQGQALALQVGRSSGPRKLAAPSTLRKRSAKPKRRKSASSSWATTRSEKRKRPLLSKTPPQRPTEPAPLLGPLRRQQQQVTPRSVPTRRDLATEIATLRDWAWA